MKIKVYGKAHLEGVAKKTGNPYNFNQVHYLGKEYNVEFDNRGYVVDFAPIR